MKNFNLLTDLISEGDESPILMLYTFGNNKILLESKHLNHLDPDIEINFFSLQNESWFIDVDLFEIKLSKDFYLKTSKSSDKTVNLFYEIISKVNSLGPDAAMLKFEDVFLGPNDLFNEWDASQTYAFGNNKGEIDIEIDPYKRKANEWREALNEHMQRLKK